MSRFDVWHAPNKETNAPGIAACFENRELADANVAAAAARGERRIVLAVDLPVKERRAALREFFGPRKKQRAVDKCPLCNAPITSQTCGTGDRAACRACGRYSRVVSVAVTATYEEE